MPTPSLEIPILIWICLIKELRRRGRNTRESGAFLLGKSGTRRITHFICYDDLDPTALNSGIIIFQGSGFVPLWNYCEKHKMKVLADAHTHSNSWTGQSGADRTNPMIEMGGHIALIIPHFAQRKLQGLKGVGIYEYQGNHKWKTWSSESARVRLTIL